MAGYLTSDEWSYDNFTECIIIGGAFAPRSSLPSYVLDPLVTDANGEIPCDKLTRAITSETAPSDVWMPYRRYWLGSIAITTLSLSALGIGGTHMLFHTLFVISLAAVAIAAIVRLAGTGSRIAAASLMASAAIGGGITELGGHVGHSPTFFFGLLCLAATITCYTCTRIRSVVAGFSVLGTVTAYYDILSGGIPFVFAIAACLHLMLWLEARGPNATLTGSFASLLAAGTAFGFGIALPIGLKLAVLHYELGATDSYSQFLGQLRWRMSNDGIGAAGFASLGRVFVALWESRAELFLGGRPASDVVYAVGLAGWVAGLFLTSLSWLRSRRQADVMPLVPPLAGGLSIIVWFAVFREHAFIHSWMMTRVLSLVPAMGLVAFIMTLAHWRRQPKAASSTHLSAA